MRCKSKKLLAAATAVCLLAGLLPGTAPAARAAAEADPESLLQGMTLRGVTAEVTFNEDYGWHYDEETGRLVSDDMSETEDDSTAEVTITFNTDVYADYTLSIKYGVSSADWSNTLTVTLDDRDDIVDEFSGDESLEGEYPGEYDDPEPLDGEHTLTLTFVKGWGSDDPAAYAWISDLKVISKGDGTQEAPYSISTAEELDELLYDNYSSDEYYCLDADIDMTEWLNDNEWEPVNFYGHFDGGGHVITGLKIGSEDSGYSDTYAGLFGQLESGASVTNLGIEGAEIYVESYDVCVGVLAGQVCDDNILIDNCYATGTVSVSDDSGENYVGGLVGEVEGVCLIANSWTDVEMTAGGGTAYIGGIVGYEYGEVYIANCASFGALTGQATEDNSVGGLLGYYGYSTALINSYAMGDITLTTETSAADPWEEGPDLSIGALAGNNYYEYVTDQHCFWNMEAKFVDGDGNELSVVPYGSEDYELTETSSDSECKSAEDMASAEFAAELNEGIDGINPPELGFTGEWLEWGLTGGKVLPGAVSGGEEESGPKKPEELFDTSGEEGDPYMIEDETTLRAFAASVNSYSMDYADKYIKLTANIALGDEAWTPIGTAGQPFRGVLDGGHHTVSNMTLEGSGQSANGFFGVVDGGRVKNLSVEGTMKLTVPGESGNGMVAGVIKNGAVIDGCSAEGAMTMTGSGSKSCCGGIAGKQENGGAIANSWSATDITVDGAEANIGGILGDNGITPAAEKNTLIANCANLGDLAGNEQGQNFIGGILGNDPGGIWGDDAPIFNCYSTGDITTGARSKNGATWAEDPDLPIGALVGNAFTRGADYHCFWNSESKQRAAGQLLTGVTAYGNTNGVIIPSGTSSGKPADELTADAFAETMNAGNSLVGDAGMGLEAALEEYGIELSSWRPVDGRILPGHIHHWLWGTLTFNWNKEADGSWTITDATCKCEDPDDPEAAHTDTAAVTLVEKETKAATCEDDGAITYTATAVFGTETRTETKTRTVPALGHEWGEVTFTWTKAEDGSWSATAARTCERDGDHTEEAEATVNPVSETPATCERDGRATYTAEAELDGATYRETKDEVLPALGHAWGPVTFDWTETENSWSVSAQRVCGNDETHIQQPLELTVEETEKTQADCDTAGSATYTATAVFPGEETPFTDTQTKTLTALGHKWAAPEFVWTEAEDGSWTASATRVCERDGEHTQKAQVTVKTVRVEPTDREAGSVTYTATASFEGDSRTYTNTKRIQLPATGSSGGSGSAGGGTAGGGTTVPETPSTGHAVEVADGASEEPEGGLVSAGSATADTGEEVTLTVTPEEGFIAGGVTVTDENGDPVEAVDNGDGTWSFVMPETGVTVDASFITPGSIFKDVDDSAWYRGAVAFAVNAGIMNGTAADSFDPNGTTDRGMFVTMLYRLSKEPDAAGTDFTDIPAGAYYADAVSWAAQAGIVKGEGNGLFAPEQAITRQELAVMLYRYANFAGLATKQTSDIRAFADSGDVASWARDAMEWAVGTGIIRGKDDGRLMPGAPATRVEAATVLQRLTDFMREEASR